MMELLKRFEESNGEEEDEVDEEDALAQSLNGVDLGMKPRPRPSVHIRFLFC